LAHVLPTYPRAAGSVFQAYNDILLVQQWTDVEIVDLEGISRAAISGKKPKTVRSCVSMLGLSCLFFGIFMTRISTLFPALWPRRSPSDGIFLAITSDNASIVYYKLSRGIVKPQV
ncbi:hypothetical protein B0H14DRAFT_2379226, partial [Mycena olivaceomarginata]